jgi:ABC-type sulfate/molybdate transport systems ATPase subunit
VRIEGLGCELDGRPLLAGLDFSVDGVPLALLGPSGAGKSLALRCLLGLAPPRAESAARSSSTMVSVSRSPMSPRWRGFAVGS